MQFCIMREYGSSESIRGRDLYACWSQYAQKAMRQVYGSPFRLEVDPSLSIVPAHNSVIAAASPLCDPSIESGS